MRKTPGLIAFALVLLLGITVSVHAEEPEKTAGDYGYRLQSDGTAVITAWTGTGDTVVIPEKVDGITVTVIGNDVFYNNNTIVKVVMPDTVTGINDHAFYGCRNLEEIVFSQNLERVGRYAVSQTKINELSLPKSLRYIEDSAFSGNDQIEELVIPGGVYTVQGFNGCFGLKTVTIEEGAGGIEFKAFENCIDLQTVILPNSLSAINPYAFINCDRLETIFLPANVNMIKGTSLKGCKNLKKVEVSPDNKAFYVADGMLYSTYDNALVFCPEGFSSPEIVVKDGVETIGCCAFWNCTQVSNVVIPKSVHTIELEAFSGSGIVKLEIPVNVVKLEAYAFSDCTQLQEICIHVNNRFAFGEGVFRGCSGLKTIRTDGADTVFPKDTFSGCSGLSEVIIPDNITAIEYGAFNFCFGLESVSVPESVISIDDGAFTYSSDNICFRVYPGSVAEEYCKNNNLQYELMDQTDN